MATLSTIQEADESKSVAEESVALLEHGDYEYGYGKDEALLDGNSSVNSIGNSLRSQIWQKIRLKNFKTKVQQWQSVRWLQLLQAVGVFLLPSFIQSTFFPSKDPHPTKIHPTAYLDGLRGVAALFVFFFHMSNNIYDNAHGWGALVGDEETSQYSSWLRLPFLRVFYAGPAGVCVFFVISGFALSIKPLKQMRTGDHAGLWKTLTSAVFRRPFRLFLPCWISTFIIFLTCRMGLWEFSRHIVRDPTIVTGKYKAHLSRMGSFGHQFLHWSHQSYDMIHMFNWDQNELWFYNDYDTHLWTIPVEFRASLALFLTQIALGRLRSSVRMSVLLALMCWAAIESNRWEMILFWGGALLAEINMVVSETPFGSAASSSILPAPRARSRSRSLRTGLWRALLVASFVVGLYLISYPDQHGETTPGFRTLTALIPSKYFHKRRYWQGMGGLCVVLSVSNLKALRSFFSIPPIRYLGKISFALYLVHGMVNHMFSYIAFWLSFSATGRNNGLQDKLGFLLGAVANTTVVIWAADLFYRSVDVQCVRVARWVEGKCLDPKTQ